MTASPPVRVAYVLPDVDAGGTEKHVLELARRLDRSRYSPVLYATAGGGALAPDFSRAGVPSRILSLRLSPRRVGTAGTVRNAVRLATTLARLFKEDGIGIVHAYLPASNVAASVAAALAGVPARIVSKRSLGFYKEARPVLSSLENVGNLLARAILVNSEAVARDVRERERFWDGKIRLVRNGVDPAAAAATDGSREPEDLAALGTGPAIVYVANLFPYKGHLDLVEAARAVADTVPGVRFALVGRDAGALPAVRDRVGALGLGRNVLLAGARPDPRAYVTAAAFVVHPSHEEGFPNSVLEAMAAGKAVVGTRAGGTAEAVEDGVTGLLVPPRDPPALAAAVLSLLENPAKARAMGEAGRRRVLERFTVDRMVRAMEDLYDELMRKE